MSKRPARKDTSKAGEYVLQRDPEGEEKRKYNLKRITDKKGREE